MPAELSRPVPRRIRLLGSGEAGTDESRVMLWLPLVAVLSWNVPAVAE